MPIRIKDIIAPKFCGVWRQIKSKTHRYTHYWFSGGRNSTKSSFISIAIVLLILLDRDANAIIFRKVKDTLKTSVYEQILWACNILGVSSYFRTTLSPLEITYLPTGQRILFRGMDDPAKTKSIKLHKGAFKVIWFEEADEFSGMKEIRKALQSVMRASEKFWIFYSYNPPASVKHWINKEAKHKRADKLQVHSTYLDVPTEWLPKQVYVEAEELRLTDESAYRNEYLGEVTGVSGLVFPNWETFTDEEKPKHFDDVILGLDFGFNHPSALIKCQFKEKAVYLEEIFYERHKTNGELVELMNALGVSKTVDIIADSAEPDRIREMWNADYNIRGAVKTDVVTSINVLKGYKIYIHADSKNLQSEFSEYQWKQDSMGEPMDKIEPNKQHDDAIAAVRYAVQYYDKHAGTSFITI